MRRKVDFKYPTMRDSLVAQMVKSVGNWFRSLELGRCPGEGNGNPLLENPMDRGDSHATVYIIL